MRSILLRSLACGVALLFSLSAQAGERIDALAAEIERGAHAGIDGFVLRRGGEERIAALAGSRREIAPDIRSATKSITALLVGIAIDRGLVADVDQRVADLLPEYEAAFTRDPAKRAITLEHLLSMRSGLDCDDWNPDSPGHEDTMYRRRDWIAFWIAQPLVNAPGTQFSYCTGNAIALGRILKHASGHSVAEFAQVALFEPLGIREAGWARWNRGADIDSGGHLRLAPRDLARVGELVLARGRHGEVQLVSETWIDAMTTVRTDIPGRKQRYGYLWWLDETTQPNLPRTRLWMAWGNGGNFLVLMPELDTGVAFSGTRYNREDALEPLFWLRDRILPELEPAPPRVPAPVD
jgi:CubicO group peptidase (beta-lactamase class C family)